MNALDDFVRDTAATYLQSIVFVDDKIYLKQLPVDLGHTASGTFSGLKPQFTAEQIEEGTAPANDDGKTTAGEIAEGVIPAVKQSDDIQGQGDFHPRDLMESFAQHGIVCALYEPRIGFRCDPNSDLFRLCERADVVILDWDLHNDDGDGASALIAELIKKSAADLPHHVRLCALYTDRPSLQPIIQQLLDKLEKHKCEVKLVPGKLQLESGATRISIFGKPHTAGRPPEDKPYEIEETKLADSVISEFASLHHGLMPAFALHGLASIRRNTKRLMDKFDTKLDGAFLLHRALVLDDRDAFDELPELLSDEILAVLEDTKLSGSAVNDIASAAIKQLSITKPGRDWTNLEGAALNYDQIFRGLLAGGEKGFRAALKDSIQEKEELEKKGFRGIKPQLLKDFDEILNNESRVEKLAALFCTRTQYGDDGRKLSFGTVVRHKDKEGDAWKFSVCLMPICDSQRLGKKVCNFPFWRLSSEAKSANPGKRSGIAIIDPEGKTQSFAVGGKIRGMLWLQEFTPGPNGTVIATQNGGSILFSTGGGKIIEWVAELKPLHAQRIAAHMGTEVSRIGLVESEWLRLFCDR